MLSVDLGGEDTYRTAAGAAFTAGSAPIGFGVNVDLGSGDDQYVPSPAAAGGATPGQTNFVQADGSGGVLVDDGGDDAYIAHVPDPGPLRTASACVQACGGELFDLGGD